MSPAQQAQKAYRIFKDNAAKVAEFTAERDSLMSSMMLDPGFGVQITSGTINGANFAGASIQTNAERLDVLDRFLVHVAAGVPPATNTYAGF